MKDIIKIEQNECFNIIKNLNELNNYVKKNMEDDDIFIIHQTEFYLISKMKPYYSIRGRVLDISNNFNNWMKDKTFKMKINEIFNFKKYINKKDISFGFIDNDDLYILCNVETDDLDILNNTNFTLDSNYQTFKNIMEKYKDYQNKVDYDEEEPKMYLYHLKHNININITKIIDKINMDFNRCTNPIIENILFDYETYESSDEIDSDKLFYKTTDFYETSNDDVYHSSNISVVSLDEKDNFIASIPSKILLKFGKLDKSYFNIYDASNIGKEQFKFVVYNVENSSFKLSQLFITI